MLKLGVKMEDATRPATLTTSWPGRLLRPQEDGERRGGAYPPAGARPSENGTNPVGAAVLKTDVSKLTPAQCEELERRAMRGADHHFLTGSCRCPEENLSALQFA